MELCCFWHRQKWFVWLFEFFFIMIDLILLPCVCRRALRGAAGATPSPGLCPRSPGSTGRGTGRLRAPGFPFPDHNRQDPARPGTAGALYMVLSTRGHSLGTAALAAPAVRQHLGCSAARLSPGLCHQSPRKPSSNPRLCSASPGWTPLCGRRAGFSLTWDVRMKLLLMAKWILVL